MLALLYHFRFLTHSSITHVHAIITPSTVTQVHFWSVCFVCYVISLTFSTSTGTLYVGCISDAHIFFLFKVHNWWQPFWLPNGGKQTRQYPINQQFTGSERVYFTCANAGRQVADLVFRPISLHCQFRDCCLSP